MENRIYQITKDELNSIKQQLNSKSNTWIAEIDGDNISTWQDYADEIERVFKFPANIIEMHVNGLSIDGYNSFKLVKRKRLCTHYQQF